MSKEKEIIKLYLKEREYEQHLFGDYKDIEPLSLPSFLIFLKNYVEKAMSAYTEKWETELPAWLETCKEFDRHGGAPVKAYEEVIKIMALAGAALETYTTVNAEKWRENPEEDSKKWRH